jgi:RNA polymerase sigma factor (TIGR02999 family)
MEGTEKPITELLQLQRSGDRTAAAQLFDRMYRPLRAMAAQRMSSERPDHTLSATALVHEVYLKLVDKDLELHDRAHFFATAATVMRRILVDHARAHGSAKRGSADKLPLDEDLVPAAAGDDGIVALDDALNRLSAFDERKGKVIELVYFGGLTQEEAASALEISPATVYRELRMAKAWLRHELGHGREA